MRNFLLAMLFVAAGASAQERSLHWDYYRVNAHIDAEGTARISETMRFVFDGPWNGGERIFTLQPGESVRLLGIARLASDGTAVPLRQGDLDEVDEYAFTAENTLRWRSRLPDDPPFAATPITYGIEYEISGIVRRTADGYLLDLDLVPLNLAGPIEHFRWELSFDEAWQAPEGVDLQGRGSVAPGERVNVRIPLQYIGSGQPGDVLQLTTAPVALLAALALLLPIAWAIRTFVREERNKGRFDPLPSLDSVDRGWIEQHVLRHKPEIIGAAWDERIAGSEVGALIARMVQEGKLRSRVEEGAMWSGPQLHLDLLVDRGQLSGYERELVDAFFFAGNQTSTAEIREHYKSTGFDPASKIKKPIETEVDEMVGPERRPSEWNWKIALALTLGGLLIMVFSMPLGSQSDRGAAAAGVGIGLGLFMLGIISAAFFKNRVAYFQGPATGMVISIVGIVLAFAILLYQAIVNVPISTITLIAVGLYGGGLVDVILGMARLRQSRERMELRRDLAQARRWFAAELEKPEPQLDDAWFPWIIAFGLGPVADRWFKSFGGEMSGMTAATGSSRSSSGSGFGSSGWTGGGGGFGGAGASASWGAAAAVLGSGVSAPSSGGSGGGGGGGSSGGGGAGGW